MSTSGGAVNQVSFSSGRRLDLRPEPRGEEVALVSADAETQAGFVRVVIRRDVRAPDQIVLLEAQAVDCAVAGVGDAERSPARHSARTGRARIRPARAARIPARRHRKREAPAPAHRRVDLARAHVRKARIVERRVGELRQHVARARSAHVEHRARRRVSTIPTLPSVGQMPLDRRSVAYAERAAGDEVEAIVRRAA